MKSEEISRRSFLGGLAPVPIVSAEVQAAEPSAKKWKLVIACDHFGFPMKGRCAACEPPCAIEVGIEMDGGPATVSTRFALEVMEGLGWNAAEHRCSLLEHP